MMTNRTARARLFLRERIGMYRIWFSHKPRWPDFRNSFTGQAVLRDLAVFCRAGRSTYHFDPRIHARLEGRRDVWLRIQQHVQLSEDELFTLLSGESLPVTVEEDDA